MRTQKGFTLLEVMIAVAIAAFLMTTIYGVFTSTSRAHRKVEDSSSRFHQTRVFFERFSRELRGANWSADNAGTAFVCTVEDNQFKEIRFSTSADAVYGTAGSNGMMVRYILEEDAEDFKTLYRSTSVAEKPDSSEASQYIMVSHISAMGLRFYNKGDWFEKWNSEDEKKLPRMVEITLHIQFEEQVLPFSTTVDLPMALN